MPTNKTQQQLIEKAIQAQKHAHAPYSNFQVGAAIMDETGSVHASCNVENAAYPLGQCAEAGAISAMVASGSKQIRQILIVSPNNEFCPPCGGCRQKIAEFATADTQVHLYTLEGALTSLPFTDLLPMQFGFEKS